MTVDIIGNKIRRNSVDAESQSVFDILVPSAGLVGERSAEKVTVFPRADSTNANISAATTRSDKIGRIVLWELIFAGGFIVSLRNPLLAVEFEWRYPAYPVPPIIPNSGLSMYSIVL